MTESKLHLKLKKYIAEKFKAPCEKYIDDIRFDVVDSKRKIAFEVL